jgi:hypothetical protein
MFYPFTHCIIISGWDRYITNRLFDYNGVKIFNVVVMKPVLEKSGEGGTAPDCIDG